LERPDYWSINQTAGAVFTRTVAIEAIRREAVATALLAPAQRTGGTAIALTRERLQALCRSSDLEFVATWGNLGATEFAAVTPVAQRPHERMRLYRCAALTS
jgi:hypothetical protein